MSLGFTLAMPVDSKWAVFHHGLNKPLGTLVVLSHRTVGIEVHWDALNKRGTLAYPLAHHWRLEGEHIRIADNIGKLRLTLAPA